MENITLWQMLACCVAAFVGGFATAITGSGGLITFPVYLTANIPPFVVLGTNKAALAMGLTQSSYKYFRENMVQWSVLRKWALPTMLLSGGAAYGIRHMNDRTWTFLVAAIVMIAALGSFPRREKTDRREFVSYFPPFMRPYLLTLVYLYDGAAGPAGGALAYLSLLHTRKKSENMTGRLALGTSRVLHLFSAIGASAVLAYFELVAWNLVLFLAVFSMVGNYFGAELGSKLSNEKLRYILFAVCVLSALALCLKLVLTEAG